MANNGIKKTLEWLEVELCLMNKDDHSAKLSGTLAADKINMLTMKIKIDTGCSELALPSSLTQQLKLKYVDTVKVSFSTGNNVLINRRGPVLIYWDGPVCEVMAYSIPSLDSPLLGLGSQVKIEYFAKEHDVKIYVTNEGGSKMFHIISANRLDINIDHVAQTVAHFATSLKPINFKKYKIIHCNNTSRTETKYMKEYNRILLCNPKKNKQ